MKRTNGISILICCYNSAKLIEKTLDHLMCQTGLGTLAIEIVVVDNNSDDGTFTIAEKYLNSQDVGFGLTYKVLKENKPGKPNALITGMNNVTYQYTVICDDDNWLNADYLNMAYELICEDDKIGIIGGFGILASHLSPPSWFSRYQAAYAVGPNAEKEGETKAVWGAGSVINMKAWDNLFENDFKLHSLGEDGKAYGEDIEYCLAMRLLGYKIVYNSRLIYQHFMPDARLKKEYYLNIRQYSGRIYKNILPYLILLEKRKDIQGILKKSWSAHKFKALLFTLIYQLRVLISPTIENKAQYIFNKEVFKGLNTTNGRMQIDLIRLSEWYSINK